MPEKNIFVVEYITGGGFYSEEIPPSLLSEGYAMLRSIIQDYKALGYRVITQIDERILFLLKYLSADEIKIVSSGKSFNEVFQHCLNKVDHCFIIAPEFSNTLYNLTKCASDLKKKIMSIGTDGIKLATSKIETFKYFKNNEIKTPLTFLIPSVKGKFDFDFIYEKFMEYKVPFIIKPDDGVGAENIYFFKDSTALTEYFSDSDLMFNFDRNYILQEYIPGEDYSISLIYKPLKGKLRGSLSILGINSQRIEFKQKLGASIYRGGATPVTNFSRIKNQIIRNLKNFDLEQFNGYIGIDFIISNEDEFYFIEINPRLTTAYVGIRNITKFNILSLLERTYDKSTITSIKQSGFSDYLKLDLQYKGNLAINEITDTLLPELIKKIPELITPPITMDKSEISTNAIFSCFIATKCKNSKTSKNKIIEIETILEGYQFKIVK